MKSIFIFSAFACTYSLKLIFVTTKMLRSIININLSVPFPSVFVPVNASNARFIPFASSLISAVFLVRYASKVANSVVGFIMVDMINYIRKISVHIEPRKAVSRVKSAAHCNMYVFPPRLCGYNLSNRAFIGKTNKPNEFARLRVIRKIIFKGFLGNNNELLR